MLTRRGWDEEVQGQVEAGDVGVGDGDVDDDGAVGEAVAGGADDAEALLAQEQLGALPRCGDAQAGDLAGVVEIFVEAEGGLRLGVVVVRGRAAAVAEDPERSGAEAALSVRVGGGGHELIGAIVVEAEAAANQAEAALELAGLGAGGGRGGGAVAVGEFTAQEAHLQVLRWDDFAVHIGDDEIDLEGVADAVEMAQGFEGGVVLRGVDEDAATAGPALGIEILDFRFEVEHVGAVDAPAVAVDGDAVLAVGVGVALEQQRCGPRRARSV